VSSSNCACSEPELILPSPFSLFLSAKIQICFLGKFNDFWGKCRQIVKKKALKCFLKVTFLYMLQVSSQKIHKDVKKFPLFVLIAKFD
jgi:hypothetical protein